eukprot:3333879-Pleurochrysis_carterae.AAC.1
MNEAVVLTGMEEAAIAHVQTCWRFTERILEGLYGEGGREFKRIVEASMRRKLRLQHLFAHVERSLESRERKFAEAVARVAQQPPHHRQQLRAEQEERKSVLSVVREGVGAFGRKRWEARPMDRVCGDVNSSVERERGGERERDRWGERACTGAKRA